MADHDSTSLENSPYHKKQYDIVSQLTILSLALEGLLSLASHSQIEDKDVYPLITMVNTMKEAI